MGNQLGLKNLIVFLREQPVFPKVSVGYSVLADLVDQGDSEASACLPYGPGDWHVHYVSTSDSVLY